MFNESEYEIIPLSFYQGDDVVEISKQLVGKYLFHQTENGLISGKIVETEAYNGRTDKACHAYHKRTQRTEVMYETGGRVYVYLCYGIHNLFNIVTNKEGMADAVLIRAVEPIGDIELMRTICKKKSDVKRLASGPGLVGKAFHFNVKNTGLELNGDIWLASKVNEEKPKVKIGTRIGVDYAGEDAKLPWRFMLDGSSFLSRN